MLSTIRAEFVKLLTVRSTYGLSLIFLAIGIFFAFYVHGFQGADVLKTTDPSGALFVQQSMTMIANILGMATALIGLLLLANEYRYGTIIYAFTSSNSRSKVLAAKIGAILTYTLFYSVVATAILLVALYAGVAVSGHSMPHQDISLLAFFAKIVFVCEAYALAGLLFVCLIRNQIGAIIALLILPNTLEGILTLLLKHNAGYLPFTALQQVVQPATLAGAAAHVDPNAVTISASKGAVIFLCWLVVGWIIAWVLFLRRDAN